MSVPTLYFTRIGIDRLDGLEPSGFAVENLEPGINIVYGPNASGKTSLSGAIRQLLAPQERSERFRRAVLRASLGLDGDTASVDFDMGDIRFRRASGSQAVPALVPEGIRDRYIFALHELLQGNASDLAAELLKQSAGGFDLRGARDELGFRSSGILAADRRISESARRPKTRRRDSRQTGSARRAGTPPSGSRKRIWPDARGKRSVQTAREGRGLAEARRTVDDRAAELAGFPAGMDKLCGDEMERLRELRDRLAAVRGDLQENRVCRGRPKNGSRETRFGATPPDEPLIAILRQKCQCLRTLAATLEDRKAKLAAAAKAVEQARSLLGSRAPDSTDPLLDAGKVERLLAFAHQGKPAAQRGRRREPTRRVAGRARIGPSLGPIGASSIARHNFSAAGWPRTMWQNRSCPRTPRLENGRLCSVPRSLGECSPSSWHSRCIYRGSWG